MDAIISGLPILSGLITVFIVITFKVKNGKRINGDDFLSFLYGIAIFYGISSLFLIIFGNVPLNQSFNDLKIAIAIGSLLLIYHGFKHIFNDIKMLDRN